MKWDNLVGIFAIAKNLAVKCAYNTQSFSKNITTLRCSLVKHAEIATLFEEPADRYLKIREWKSVLLRPTLFSLFRTFIKRSGKTWFTSFIGLQRKFRRSGKIYYCNLLATIIKIIKVFKTLRSNEF